MKMLPFCLLCMLVASGSAFAKYERLTPEQAQKIIDTRFLTPEQVKATAGLKTQIDYMAENYREAELRRVILNMEKLNREMAKRNNREYVPYNQRIDLKNPDQVKRFFRSRIDTIF